MSRKFAYILTSVAFWGVGSFTLWCLLSTFETGCMLRERDSGLWAECFAPAALVYTGLFGLLAAIDLIRLIVALRKPKLAEVHT